MGITNEDEKARPKTGYGRNIRRTQAKIKWRPARWRRHNAITVMKRSSPLSGANLALFGLSATLSTTLSTDVILYWTASLCLFFWLVPTTPFPRDLFAGTISALGANSSGRRTREKRETWSVFVVVFESCNLLRRYSRCYIRRYHNNKEKRALIVPANKSRGKGVVWS